MKEKRINIMGSGPGWKDTPIDDGEIWGVNSTHLLRNVDRIIDIHDRVKPKEEKDQIHMEQLRKKSIPTYSQDEMEGFDNVKKYPLDEIVKEFDTDYFGSGIDYMIALAIYEGATDIHLYGVCMMTESEYAHQKASVEYWVGIARGRGIDIKVHGEHSVILKTRNGLIYGYQECQKFVKEENPDVITMADLMEKYE
jgi:hypothetical protein